MTLLGNTGYHKMQLESGESRRKLIKVCILGSVLDFILILVLLLIIFMPASIKRDKDVVLSQVYDRPLLTTVDAVNKARSTGVCEFNIGKEHYIVWDMPKNYVDYSAWWVRLP